MVMVIIEPYNLNWKLEFEALKEVYSQKLEGLVSDVLHVGSTSVEGMFAKPIIDIDLVIREEALLFPVTAKLNELGYDYQGDLGIADRYAFKRNSLLVPYTKPEREWQKHHLYVCLQDSIALKNHLLVRETLRNRKELAVQYGMLKQKLVDVPSFDIETYTKGKTKFLLSILKDAGLTDQELAIIAGQN